MTSIIHVTIDQLDHSASKGQVRGHTVIMDRPEVKGGQNKGPLGGETLLLGLGGCFMSNLLAAAHAREISINNAKAEIFASLGETPARYTEIRMVVSADCEHSDQLQKLLIIAERGCIAVNTLKHAVTLIVEQG